MTASTAPAYTVRPSGRSIVAPQPSRMRLPVWALFTVFVVVAFFGLIYSRISLDRSAFDLDELQEQIAIEEDRASVLQLEVARLQDPKRIARLASQMGLEYPAERVPISVDVIDERLTDVDYRWAQITSTVRAQP